MTQIVVPARYLAPKWQAYVTAADSGFTFSDGTKVSSLWQLKQALLALPEEVINHHIREAENDIVAWIKNIVGDEELAKEVSQYNHRWGILVALERQLMRTQNLPEYVAKRWLRTVDNGFTFSEGQSVHSLSELKDTLLQVSDESVNFHQERNPNDISVWISDVIGDYELAELVNEASGRTQMQRFVSDHVQMLEEAE